MKFSYLVPVALLFCLVQAGAAAQVPSNHDILQSMADDYRHDPQAFDTSVGFQIDDDRFYLVVDAHEDGPHDVRLTEGFPDAEIYYWEMSRETLLLLNEGMSGETPTMRTYNSDQIELNVRTTPGFDVSTLQGDEAEARFQTFKIHFFARGIPEIIRFGDRFSRVSHGANVSSIYARHNEFVFFWLGLQPGQHVNERPIEQINPFQTMIVVYEGQGMGRFGGEEFVMEPGEAYIIPAGVTHELWNPFDRPMEGFAFIYAADMDMEVLQRLMTMMQEEGL